MRDKKKIVFLGASITQGKISASFVKILKGRLGDKQYKYINHGIAGYESYNVLRRLDRAIRVMPDFVVLLVGTNDVTSSLDPGLARRSRKLKRIPHDPSLFHYSKNISRIIQILKERTRSKIAVVSLPVIGENLESEENETVKEYNAGLREIAENEKVTYLPVFEKQKEFLLHENGGKGKDFPNSMKLVFRSMLLHYLLFMSLDTLSKKNGFLLLTDGIHQNSSGAEFIAGEIITFIKAGQ